MRPDCHRRLRRFSDVARTEGDAELLHWHLSHAVAGVGDARRQPEDGGLAVRGVRLARAAVSGVYAGLATANTVSDIT
jgi:hypothetical protein